MRVICIDDTNQNPCVMCGSHDNEVVFGHDYTVCPESPFDDCYIVEGYEECSCGNSALAFYKHRFAPLSDIDETELAEQRKQLEPCNQ